MKLIKSQVLFDGSDENKDVFIGFESEKIVYVGNNKPEEGGEIIEGTVTPAFVDAPCDLDFQGLKQYLRLLESGRNYWRSKYRRNKAGF